jgi:hypothetical protein
MSRMRRFRPFVPATPLPAVCAKIKIYALSLVD